MRDKPWGKDGPTRPRSLQIQTMHKARRAGEAAMKRAYAGVWSPTALELEAEGCVYDPLRKPVLAVPRSVWNVNTVQDGQYRLNDTIRWLRDGVMHRRLCGGPEYVRERIAVAVRNLQSWVDHALDGNGEWNARRVYRAARKANA